MSNTYFQIKKSVETKGIDSLDIKGYTNDYTLSLTAFVGSENKVQLTVRCHSTINTMNGISHIVLSDRDIDLLIAGLLERKLGIISATGYEQSIFSPSED